MDTLLEGARAVSDLQSDVPEKTDKTFDSIDLLLRGIPGEEYQQVDVRTGMQLLATIPAYRDQRNSGLTGSSINDVVPDALDKAVNKSAVGTDDPARPTPGYMGRGQPFPGNLQLAFEIINGTGALEVALES